jgi:hypothetical protein
VSDHPEGLLRHRLFVSLGHDEYWTGHELDAVQHARDAGVNIAFLGGNEAYWQARLDASATGTGDRVLTVYKDPARDPLEKTDPAATASQFSASPVNRPTSMLSGLSFGTNATPNYQAWRPMVTYNWLFANTRMMPGDVFPGIVGYEYDHLPQASERPDGLQVVARSPVEGFAGPDTAVSSFYTARSGAIVFDAGTVAWSWGLDDFGHEARGKFADQRLQKLTANIMDRLTQAVASR